MTVTQDSSIYYITIEVRGDVVKESSTLSGHKYQFEKNPLTVPERCISCGNNKIEELKLDKREMTFNCIKGHANDYPEQFKAVMKEMKKTKIYSKKKLKINQDRGHTIEFMEFDRWFVWDSIQNHTRLQLTHTPRVIESGKVVTQEYNLFLARKELAEEYISGNREIGYKCEITEIPLVKLASSEEITVKSFP